MPNFVLIPFLFQFYLTTTPNTRLSAMVPHSTVIPCPFSTISISTGISYGITFVYRDILTLTFWRGFREQPLFLLTHVDATKEDVFVLSSFFFTCFLHGTAILSNSAVRIS